MWVRNQMVPYFWTRSMMLLLFFVFPYFKYFYYWKETNSAGVNRWKSITFFRYLWKNIWYRNSQKKKQTQKGPSSFQEMFYTIILLYLSVKYPPHMSWQTSVFGIPFGLPFLFANGTVLTLQSIKSPELQESSSSKVLSGRHSISKINPIKGLTCIGNKIEMKLIV